MKKISSTSLRRSALGTLLGTAALLLAAPGLASQAPVPQTGQSACYDQAGNQLNSCAGTGQDGETLAGAAWPAPRFTVNSDDTITDALTGLAWTRDANAPGPAACAPGAAKSWSQALSYVACLNTAGYLGHSDWRLPNIKELWSLANAGEGTLGTWLSNNHFDNVRLGRYKSSTATPGGLAATPFVMSFSDGTVSGYAYGSADYVWPVRSAAVTAAVQLPQTGATQCLDPVSGNAVACSGTGQDAELHRGAYWSGSTRFSSGTGTLDDTLTGLQWASSGRTLNFAACSGGALQWESALQFVGCLNDNLYLGKSDWRLPNLNELSSLSNAGGDDLTWLGSQGFDLASDRAYWTSSTYLQQPESAWTVLFGVNGFQSKLDKSLFGNVLPVRTLPPGSGFKTGDLNKDGAIDVRDALKLLQLYQTPAASYDALADVAPLGSDGKPGGNGMVDPGDVITLLRYLVLKDAPGAVQW